MKLHENEILLGTGIVVAHVKTGKAIRIVDTTRRIKPVEKAQYLVNKGVNTTPYRQCTWRAKVNQDGL